VRDGVMEAPARSPCGGLMLPMGQTEAAPKFPTPTSSSKKKILGRSRSASAVKCGDYGSYTCMSRYCRTKRQGGTPKLRQR
jgi:hypothetical protein